MYYRLERPDRLRQNHAPMHGGSRSRRAPADAALPASLPSFGLGLSVGAAEAFLEEVGERVLAACSAAAPLPCKPRLLWRKPTAEWRASL